MRFKTLKDFSVANQRVLVRCDFNVPVDEEGNILDDFKIQKSLPTIKYLIDNKAKVVLMSHLDPKSTGVVDKKYTLDNVASKLSDYLNISIAKESDCVGPEVEAVVNKLEQGDVLLLENLRFYKEETDNDSDFAKKLSYLGDIYVNDAFGSDHRAHASIVGVPKFLSGCMGFLLEREITALDEIIGKSLPADRQTEKPMVAIIGGKKVKTKTKFIDKISEVADWVIVSGLIKKEAEEQGIQFKYPEKILAPKGKLDDFDINEESIKIFEEKILNSKTVLWNGPFGKFEEKEYSKGTRAIADAIIKSNAFSVVGGGETIEFLQKQGIIDKFSHVSTGGGAMLSYLAGDTFPGLDALK